MKIKTVPACQPGVCDISQFPRIIICPLAMSLLRNFIKIVKFFSVLRDSRIQVSNSCWACSSPQHSQRWSHYPGKYWNSSDHWSSKLYFVVSVALPCTQERQANIVCSQSRDWWVGDGQVREISHFFKTFFQHSDVLFPPNDPFPIITTTILRDVPLFS